MMSFRFLHAADVHLDSPVGGLNGYPGVHVADRYPHGNARGIRPAGRDHYP